MSDSTSPQSFGIGYDGRRWLSALNVDGGVGVQRRRFNSTA